MKNSANCGPVCIRGLKRFEKSGCPQRGAAAGGCPAWREMIVPTRADPTKKDHRAQCLDNWYFDFQWSALGLLEGNQAATETLRNGMLTPEGPRADAATERLLEILEAAARRQALLDQVAS